MDLAKGKSVELQAVLTQHGEMYNECCKPMEDPKRPPGVYECPECGDAQLTFRTPVDKCKTRCPKCNTDMVRVAAIKPVMPIIPPI